MTVLLTLTSAGTNSGPFDLYSNLDFFVVPFETGVSKASLLGGYSSSLVPDYTTIVRAKSTGACDNFIDIVLTNTTTTTTTSGPEIPCNSTVTSGGSGVSQSFVNLSPSGGYIAFALNAQGVPDKLEIIHNGIKKATSGMTVANGGPFDNIYGDPTVPSVPQTMATDQFIGADKGAIPNRQATFASDTGSGLSIPVGFQQIVWWEYTNADYILSPTATIRVTGPTGTAWNLQRMCETTTTTTTL